MALKLSRKILCPECLYDFNHKLDTSSLVHPKISQCSRNDEVIHLEYYSRKKARRKLPKKKVHTKPIGDGLPVIQIIYPMCRVCNRPTSTFKTDTLRCIFSHHNTYVYDTGSAWTNSPISNYNSRKQPVVVLHQRCENTIVVPIASLIVWV